MAKPSKTEDAYREASDRFDEHLRICVACQRFRSSGGLLKDVANLLCGAGTPLWLERDHTKKALDKLVGKRNERTDRTGKRTA